MTTRPAAPNTAAVPGSLVRHVLEMVVTMAAGMVTLQPLWQLALRALDAPQALADPTLMALTMATDMSLGMGAWSRHRGHAWRPIAEMSAAMYLPFAVLLPVVWAGALSGEAMLVAGHLLILPTMLGLMVWRREEYGHAPAQAAVR